MRHSRPKGGPSGRGGNPDNIIGKINQGPLDPRLRGGDTNKARMTKKNGNNRKKEGMREKNR